MWRLPSTVKECNSASWDPSKHKGGTPKRAHSSVLNAGVALAPRVADVYFGVAVEHEDVGAHERRQPLRLQVIAHVGEPQPCGDAERPGHGGEDDRLGDAVRRAALDRVARNIFIRITRNGVGVVADPIADGVEQAADPLSTVLRPVDRALRKRTDTGWSASINAVAARCSGPGEAEGSGPRCATAEAYLSQSRAGAGHCSIRPGWPCASREHPIVVQLKMSCQSR